MLTKSNEYFEEYKSTEIPIIQRDYVQGADYWRGKRDPFVRDLLSSLRSNTCKTINFIYGVASGDVDKRFIPLDGQQRLTTLNLLGWMLLQGVRLTDRGKYDPSCREKLGLTYRTRESSKEFCAKLLESDLANFNEKPSGQIKESLWFAESWSYDPTVRAMLEMLDYLWAQLKGYEQELAEMARRYFTDSPIDFELLTMKDSNNPDDFYIKINARGKALTEFEHWKAWFIGKLGKLDGGQGLKNEFETKIETDWCDFFWQFAKKDKVDYPRIDEYFMRFFTFVTDILRAFADPDGKSYSDHIKERNDEAARKVIEEIYFSPKAGPTNLRLLFNLLDTLPKVGDLSDYLFSATNPQDQRIATERRKVNIFGDDKKLDLLSLLLEGGNLDLRQTFLVWGIIRYVALHGAGQLQEFIRVWWGILMNIRQRNAPDEVKSNIRRNELCEWSDMLDTILKDSDPFANTGQLNAKGALSLWLKYNSTAFPANNRTRYDADIVRLQNHPWLLYDVHVLDELITDPSIPAGEVFDRFNQQFVSLPDKTRAKALLEHGFTGCVPKSSYLTYGLTDNWAYILSDDDSSGAAPLCALLKGEKAWPPISWPSDFVWKYYDQLKDMPENVTFYVDGHYGILFGSKKSLRKQGYIQEPYNYVTAVLANLTVHYGKAAVKYGTSGCDDELTLYTVDSKHWGICFQRYKLEIEPVKSGWWLRSYDDGSDLNVKSPTAAFTARFGSPMAWGDSQGVFRISPDGFVSKLPGKDRVDTGVELLKAIIALL